MLRAASEYSTVASVRFCWGFSFVPKQNAPRSLKSLKFTVKNKNKKIGGRGTEGDSRVMCCWIPTGVWGQGCAAGHAFSSQSRTAWISPSTGQGKLSQLALKMQNRRVLPLKTPFLMWNHCTLARRQLASHCTLLSMHLKSPESGNFEKK